MKKLLLVLMIATTISAKAQRAEGCNITICYSGYQSGSYVLSIYNPSNYSRVYNIEWPNGVYMEAEPVSKSGRSAVIYPTEFKKGIIKVTPVNCACSVYIYVSGEFPRAKCY